MSVAGAWMRPTFAAVFLVGMAALGFAAAGAGYTFYTQTLGIGSNNLAFDTLDPPTGLNATGGSTAALNWTASTDAYASGHRVLRGTAAGGPYLQIAELTPRTATSYTDAPPPGTYYYVVRAFFQNWESANGNEVSAAVSAPANTGLLNCAANGSVATGSGDNNGYQLNPGNACADDAAFAEDTNSGTNTNTTCSNTGKDRHLYYNYGIAVPVGSTITGIKYGWMPGPTALPAHHLFASSCRGTEGLRGRLPKQRAPWEPPRRSTPWGRQRTRGVAPGTPPTSPTRTSACG